MTFEKSLRKMHGSGGNLFWDGCYESYFQGPYRFQVVDYNRDWTMELHHTIYIVKIWSAPPQINGYFSLFLSGLHFSMMFITSPYRGRGNRIGTISVCVCLSELKHGHKRIQGEFKHAYVASLGQVHMLQLISIDFGHFPQCDKDVGIP